MIPDMDPSKIVAMIENLFGLRLGRFLAISLLAARQARELRAIASLNVQVCCRIGRP